MNKKIFPLLLLLPVVFLLGRLSAQEDVQPSCLMCAAEYVSLEEISKYMQVGRDKGITDQQLRSIDVGRAKVQIAVAHRGQLEQRIGRVAEHDLVTEVYYVLSGSGDIMTSPELIDSVRRADDNRAVMTLNGPGHNAADVRNGVTHQLKAGDVFIIPAGTGHEFTRIPDHITYLMIRVDPDKVVPLMNADESANYLDEQL
ncbi:MAG: AraC family ligand binding domain-containing protein [Proteobacteria bacterium]|nr:AraC family ligand binding domain-containing protein [Pseudomonadota bacterium]